MSRNYFCHLRWQDHATVLSCENNSSMLQLTIRCYFCNKAFLACLFHFVVFILLHLSFSAYCKKDLKKSPILLISNLKKKHCHGSQSRQPLENSSFSHVFMSMHHYSLDETLVSLNQYILCEYKFVYSMKITFICTQALGNNPFYQRSYFTVSTECFTVACTLSHLISVQSSSYKSLYVIELSKCE